MANLVLHHFSCVRRSRHSRGKSNPQCTLSAPCSLFSSLALRVCCSAITTKSIIFIQTYQSWTLIGRRKFETVTIQGDDVFRFCSARPRPGNKHCACFFVYVIFGVT